MVEGDVSVFKEKPEVGNFPHFPNFYICTNNSSNISHKLTSQQYVISDLGVHSSEQAKIQKRGFPDRGGSSGAGEETSSIFLEEI